jgi:exodeoxyribonuclease VII small subunit
MTELADLTFEQALQRLEEIVTLLDSGDLALEDAIARFEEGVALKTLCLERLAQAEAKIEQYALDGATGDVAA